MSINMNNTLVQITMLNIERLDKSSLNWFSEYLLE